MGVGGVIGLIVGVLAWGALLWRYREHIPETDAGALAAVACMGPFVIMGMILGTALT